MILTTNPVIVSLLEQAKQGLKFQELFNKIKVYLILLRHSIENRASTTYDIK